MRAVATRGRTMNCCGAACAVVAARCGRQRLRGRGATLVAGWPWWRGVGGGSCAMETASRWGPQGRGEGGGAFG